MDIALVKNLTADDRAYVVYSSGTTGKPKGIACPHRGAVISVSLAYGNVERRSYLITEASQCHRFSTDIASTQNHIVITTSLPVMYSSYGNSFGQ